MTIQGDIEVAQFLELNGPRGVDSHLWMSLALQSFMSTSPKMWSVAWDNGMGSPWGLGDPPMKQPISNS